MSTSPPTTSIDALLLEGAWLRRLAAALVSDAATAEDLVQETWVTALRSPPRAAEAARAWLRRVLLSRLYDGGRSRQRRQVREQVSFDLQTDVELESPEELTARMEIHRRLAIHLAAVDERLREVLFLRFVEDLEPIEVARRLAIPDGTARWRLKRGLDELRARLDADAERDRRRWLPLLAPLAEQKQPATTEPLRRRAGYEVARRKGWAARLAWLATIGALLAVALLALHSRPGATAGDGARSVTGAPSTPEDSNQSPRPPNADAVGELAAASASPEPPCPEAVALEKERDALASATDPTRVRFKTLFLDSPTNTTLEEKLAPVVAPLMFGPAKCGHSFECRGVVCRAGFVVPQSADQEEMLALEKCYAPLREAMQVRTLGMDLDYVGKTFDPIAHASFSRFDVYYRLVDPSGDTVPPEQRQLPKLPAGWDRDRGAIPATLVGTCRARVLRLRGELESLQRKIPLILPLWSVFQQSSANSSLEHEVSRLLQPILSLDGKGQPVVLECRGRICALRPNPSVPESAMRWGCQDPSTTGCSASTDGDWWYARLYQRQAHLSFVDRYAWPWRYNGEEIPTMLSIRRPDERHGILGPKLVLKLARDLRFASLVAVCERQSPAKGALTILVNVPETCGGSSDGDNKRITVEYGGELGNSALADCLRLATERALSQVELPGCSYRWAHEWRLDFPHPKIELGDSGG